MGNSYFAFKGAKNLRDLRAFVGPLTPTPIFFFSFLLKEGAKSWNYTRINICNTCALSRIKNTRQRCKVFHSRKFNFIHYLATILGCPFTQTPIFPSFLFPRGGWNHEIVHEVIFVIRAHYRASKSPDRSARSFIPQVSLYLLLGYYEREWFCCVTSRYVTHILFEYAVIGPHRYFVTYNG